ncbi:hypothetical protein JL720_16498 [Aureococcus anophagefferens]|nr:hypothetical protein JL720_16498 [Aureococcus anophagefferens]
MDWGASPSSWTCGFSEYTCTPGNGATDLRDCPAIYEDSIVVAPREMRSESEKRFEALMGEGGGDAAVPVAAVEHLEVGDAAPRATAIAVRTVRRRWRRGAFFASVGAMAEDAAAFRAWRDDHFPRQARAPAVVPPDFAAFCRATTSRRAAPTTPSSPRAAGPPTPAPSAPPWSSTICGRSTAASESRGRVVALRRPRRR